MIKVKHDHNIGFSNLIENRIRRRVVHTLMILAVFYSSYQNTKRKTMKKKHGVKQTQSNRTRRRRKYK